MKRWRTHQAGFSQTGEVIYGAMWLAALLGGAALQAQIPVGTGGAGPLTFNTTPLAAEFSTGVLNGGATTYNSLESMDAGAQTVNATNVLRRLPTDGAVPPVSFSGGFRHNTTGLYLQSRPTTDNTNAASLLVATLRNMSVASIVSCTVSYDFSLNSPLTGEVPGFRVFFSLSGAPGSWQLIPALSSTVVAGPHAANVSPGFWAPGALLYLLWADDNANSITDPSYVLDNFSITAVVTEVVADTCVGLTNQPSSLTVGEHATAAFTVGATGTPQFIQWYRNGSVLPGATGTRYAIHAVSYQGDNGASFHAVVSNSLCTATSTAALLTVLPDTNAPTVLSAIGDASLDTVRVTFSEPIFDTGNLEAQFIVFPRADGMPGGEELITIGYYLTNDNRTAVLALNPAREFGSNYSIYVTQITDVSSAQNAIAPDPTILPITSTVQLIGFDTDNEWKYSLGHTLASNLHGTGWEQPGYDDSAWLSGPAGLGLDTGQPNGVPIRTPLPYVTDAVTAVNVTTYFRRHFHFLSAPEGVSLTMRDVVEDGAVYYLNGQEIFRNRMPAGPVTFATTTPSASEPQPISGPFTLAITNLWPGENVLAVEVHQNGLTSSDLEFAAEWIAAIPTFATFVNPALSIAREPGTGLMTIRWPGSGVLQQTTNLQATGTSWTYVPGNPNPHLVTPPPTGHRFFRLRP